MNYAILSDVHSNIQALESALEKCSELKVDKIICLGDVIGYNANPVECLHVAQEKFDTTILGNHDYIAARGIRFSDWAEWSSDALKAIEYTLPMLSSEDKQWLSLLPSYKSFKESDIHFTVGHGIPFDSPCNDRFDYILGVEKAHQIMSLFKDLFRKENTIRLGFFGHTHIQALARSRTDDDDGDLIHLDFDMGEYILDETVGLSPVNLDKVVSGEEMMLVNPGSIGQPRHRCKPSFVLMDTDEKTLEWVTFDYDVEAAKEAIRAGNYCNRLAERLNYINPMKELF